MNLINLLTVHLNSYGKTENLYIYASVDGNGEFQEYSETFVKDKREWAKEIEAQNVFSFKCFGSIKEISESRLKCNAMHSEDSLEEWLDSIIESRNNRLKIIRQAVEQQQSKLAAPPSNSFLPPYFHPPSVNE